MTELEIDVKLHERTFLEGIKKNKIPKVLENKVTNIFNKLKTFDWPEKYPTEDSQLDTSFQSVISSSTEYILNTEAEEEEDLDLDNLQLDERGVTSRLNQAQVKIVIAIRKARRHYIYIFVDTFQADFQSEDEQFQSFVNALFYVGQGVGPRFNKHFKLANKPTIFDQTNNLPVLEQVMQSKKSFFAEILYDDLTQEEANYLEARLIQLALINGKHCWRSGHNCEVKNFTSSCLCNAQIGNSQELPNAHPLCVNKDDLLLTAFKLFMAKTWNACTMASATKLRIVSFSANTLNVNNSIDIA